MTIQQIKYVIGITETGSFNKAAEKNVCISAFSYKYNT